ncbi:PD-(D/E)XK nuclease family protein [Porphyrobacter sp. LM 6]|jgi:hypothetical protein|uniref:PD-(D/E)XK nuclease family protein n=1 Tax=Porphyrobacter sp. LM 6 TaxID=1896196 RepID=UPI0008638139|nr:PD-(D/E)XK nuclease family protein [Porphyrobacter sp. LM 6]AOL94014.1 PD-(D/E)XK nuclease superfamily protein [Porphyrobacter sp. LM 6]
MMFDRVYLRIGSGPIAGCQPLTVSLLSSLYALPAFPEVSVRDTLMRHIEDAPWSESFGVAPEQTAAAVSAMLTDVMLATTDFDATKIDLSTLPQNERAKLHLDSLVDLWKAVPDVISAEMRTIQAFLQCSANDALQQVQVIWDRDSIRLTSLERAIVERLEGHHGAVPDNDPDYLRLIVDPKISSAPPGSLLGHIQRHIFDASATRVEDDESLVVLSVRDSLSECEAAAAIAQNWLAKDANLNGSEIGIIVPDIGDYSSYLAEAFAHAGLAVSSLPSGSTRRNVGAEAVLLFVQCRRRPAPAMALASLYASPILCWPKETGYHLATRVMDGDFSPKLSKELKGKSAELYELIRSASPANGRELASQLRQFGKLLSEDEGIIEDVWEARNQITRLAMSLEGAADRSEPDWDVIFKTAGLYQEPAAVKGTYYLGGVSVLRASDTPSRKYRKLIILGFNDGSYPRPSSGTPFFLDSEIALIEEKTGLCLPCQQKQLRQGLELFETQLRSASEQVITLYSERDRLGSFLAPSSSLPLLSRLVEGIKEPADFVAPLERGDGTAWDRLITWRSKPEAARVEPKVIPEFYELDRNLLMLRQTPEGKPRPQSPSSLETLLISPLAWVLSELGARHVPWQPEQLTVALRGSLAHEVFERLFVPDQPIPTDDEIDSSVPELLADRIRAIAPFLQASTWKVEQQALEGEILKSAKHWALVLKSLGATLIGNEFWLAGEILEHPVHGKADCLICLPDGLPLIVDYKKSSTGGRRNRLRAQWDLQVDLYRKMSVRTNDRSTSDELKVAACLEAWSGRPAVAYHLLNDGGVLINGADGLDPSFVEVIEGDIAENANGQLQSRFQHLRAGRMETNAAGDEKFYKNKAYLGVYALSSSPLIKTFMREDGEAAGPSGGATDE